METLVTTAFRRLRPQHGWFPFVLLTLMVATLLGATVEVGWVPQTRLVIPLAAAGFVLGTLLAHSSLPAFFAWLVLSFTGLLLSVSALAGLRPPGQVLAEGGPALIEFASRRVLLFSDRIVGWAEAVAAGDSSTETMAFAFGLLLAAWIVSAFVAWSVFRLDRPLAGITAAGVAMALTGYFGQAPLYWVVSFIGLAVTVLAALRYGAMELSWERRGIDYSGEVKGELLIAAAVIGMILMSLAFALPSANIRSIAQAFRGQPAIAGAEAALERAFAGVEQPRLDDSAGSAGVARPAGILPRAFLLGAAPELLETVVMTATVTVEPADNADRSPDGRLAGAHWRGGSYDVYTGRGWQRSGEREVVVPANLPVGEAPLPSSSLTVSQTIAWAGSPLLTRYALGSPDRFDHATTVYWRGEEDLSRIVARSTSDVGYTATSHVSPPDEQELRRVTLEGVPRALLSRHTALPADIPQRVHDLAREVALSDPTATPFDQARAIERFLRQYPYSLDVSLPPPDVDMTDYFLFDLQRGFCDYYATAMVVMARSVGLPARLATGFLQSSQSSSQEQIIRQSNAHSWAEIYFPGYGWVEFEPTAPAVAPESPVFSATSYGQDGRPDYTPPATQPPVAVPDRAPQRDVPWPLVVVTAVLGGTVAFLLGRRVWQRRRSAAAHLDAIESAYVLLQEYAHRLGVSTMPGETPLELAESVSQESARLLPDTPLPEASVQQVGRVAALFVEHQYAAPHRRPSGAMMEEARQLGDGLRKAMRRLRWVRLRSGWR